LYSIQIYLGDYSEVMADIDDGSIGYDLGRFALWHGDYADD